MKALQQSKEELKTHLHFLVSLKIKQYKLVTDRLEYIKFRKSFTIVQYFVKERFNVVQDNKTIIKQVINL